MTNPTGSILLRRGPTVDRLAFTPIEGEIIYDTLLKKIFIGDGLTPGGRTVTSDIVIGGSGEILNIPNSSLENSTISGVELGQNLRTLTFGTGLSGISYNGSTAVTVAIDATSNNVLNSVVARDTNGDFSARRITAELIGNASTATNGVVTTGSYANPSWITSLGESKVLPAQGPHAGKVLTTNGSSTSWTNLIPESPAANQMAPYGRWLNTNGTTLQWTDPYPTQSGNSGKFLSTNGSFVGWASAAAIGFPSIVGNNGKYLTVSGSDIIWSDIAGGDSINTPNKLVLRDASGNFAAGTITANLTGNVTGNITGNADTVTNGVYTSNSYTNPTWITGLSLTQGGTGAANRADALTNLLPTGESIGYVLTTTGRGSYFWAAGGGGGGGGNVGNTITSSRTTFTATEGQTLFTGVSNYVPGAGQLRIFIDGVRQFPSEYVETSSTSFTLNVSLPAGVKVFAEIDAYTGVEIPASTITFSPVGDIEATNVQLAITELDVEKAPIASPTFTGTVTIPAGASISGYAPIESPTFTGTVGGITATMVGLGNVTNESKATMFSSPTFTGTVSGVTATHVGLGNVTNESKATMFSSPTFTGNASFSSYASIKALIETSTITASSPISNQPFDVITQGVQYYTSATANAFTLNVRGNNSTTLGSMLAVGQSTSIGLLVTCSNSAHYMSAVNIDGTATGVTTRWQGGATPTTGNASSIDVYTLTIIKTAATPTYTVLATQTRFG